jgi:hypothetical protein
VNREANVRPSSSPLIQRQPHHSMRGKPRTDAKTSDGEMMPLAEVIVCLTNPYDNPHVK